MAERFEQSDHELERRVTERTRELEEANAALQRENAQWKRLALGLQDRELAAGSLIDGIPGLIATLMPDGVVETVNRQILEYTGQSVEELRNWRTNGTVHPKDMAHAARVFGSSVAKGLPYEIEQRLRHHNGAYRWFSNRGTPARDAEGRIIRWHVLLTDIDDRKQAEEAVRTSGLNYRKILDTLPVAVWTTRPDGYCDFLNRRWLDYAGYTAEQAEGWGWATALHADDANALGEIWKTSLATGKPADAEARVRRHDGAYRWFLFRVNVLRDEEGNVVKWYGANIDIEDSRRAEEAIDELRSELAHMSRVSSLGVLTASVAHEVSQPLSGIITNSNTSLRMLSADPPNVQGAIETARRNVRDANRAAEVVARLRALFSKKTGKTAAVDLNEALMDVIALISSDLQKKRVTLRTNCAAGLPYLIADRVQLQQVMLNLLLNAADAMSSVADGRRIILVKTARDGDAVNLSVTDAGVGFAAEDAERLFEAFYTTKMSGMGIGLCVSRSIIESHEGRLWGEPNDGPGATFSFVIPLPPRA